VGQAARKRRPKAAVLRDLDELLQQGETLLARAIPDELALAWVSVEKLVWRQSVMALLIHVTRGISVASDFGRCVAGVPAGPYESLGREIELHRQGLTEQIKVLRQAVEKWRVSGTRPLHGEDGTL
jgi:hypothetical protein